MEDDSQLALFNVEEWWEKQWKGMPEFVQKDLSPHKTIYVHFDKVEDLDAFAELVGQTVTSQTISIWYPKAEIDKVADKRWVEALPDPDQLDMQADPEGEPDES